jgi:cell division protein FtsW (lipid II flippase)/cell division protein FtsI/penicillin-binding protein 2
VQVGKSASLKGQQVERVRHGAASSFSREQETSRWGVVNDARALVDLPVASSSDGQERLLLVLAGLFVSIGAITLAAAELGHWSLVHWSLVAVWVLCFGAAHVVLCRYAPDRDPLLLPLAGLLTGWGLLLIARLADVSFLLRQSIWLAISVAVFLLIAARPPGLRWLRRYRYTWLLGGLALLATTLVFGTNPSGFGPRLWLGGRVLGLGLVYFQPSEILKLLMVAYLASYLAEKRMLVLDGPRVGRMRLPSFPFLAPLLVMWGLAMILLGWQRDLGAALLFFLTFLVMLYQASGSWGYVLAGLGLLLVAAAGAYALLDTVSLRVDIWLNPWVDPDGRAFQIVQSLIAFATGGLFGQGLGEGSPTFIPAVHTDFPFTAIGEEFGLVGTLGLIVAYAVLTVQSYRIALHARTSFRRLLAAGLATLIGLQAWIIMAGNLKLVPLTGVTLPFVSYGGSSLLSSFVVLALLMAISRDAQSYAGSLEAGRASDMTDSIRHVSLVLLVAFAGLALVSGYWALVRQDGVRNRDDNPRLVAAEQRVPRGPILDRDGVVLARSRPRDDEIQARTYLTPTVPAVGYYSLKHGVGGIEASADPLLRGLEGRSEGDLFLDELLHRQPKGRGVGLTIDNGLQGEIAAMMGSVGRDGTVAEETRPKGAVLVLDVENGEILASISQPTYDPNTLDADWEQLESDPDAPLLNRATQGLYQPGGALWPVVLSAGLEAGVVDLDAPAGALEEPVAIDGRTVSCVRAPQGATLADALAAGCPAASAKLGADLGVSGLEQAFRDWGLDVPPFLEIPTESGEATVMDPALAAIGQEQLTVTPLHLALVAATIGNAGMTPPAHLKLMSEGEAGRWQQTIPEGRALQVVDPDLADRLRTLFEPSSDGQVLGYTALAVAGEERPAHAWFLGLAPAQTPRYAAVVLLEHGGDESLALAEQIGHRALVAALELAP